MAQPGGGHEQAQAPAAAVAVVPGRDREAMTLALAIGGIALVAFLVRLIGMLRGAGLVSIMGHDDSVYYSAAAAFIEGRLPYRDFNLLHPPGIVYLLSPFAALGGAIGDSGAFALGRLSFMVLGAVNTVLVALVARRVGTTAAICAAAIYAVWLVPASWERTTYLVAPQATLLLIALHLLASRPTEALTARRTALAGVAIGIAGVIQVWTVVPAAVLFAWLVISLRTDVTRLARLTGAYVVGGLTTAFILLLPFLLTTGQDMLRLIVFGQLNRTGAFSTGRVVRLRFLEGFPPDGTLDHHLPARAVDLGVIALFVVVAAAFLYVAWKRPEIRLWVALLIAQTAFLMITPVFFGHYGGWIAPLVAVCAGATAATVFERLRVGPRRVAIGVFAIGLAGLLVLGVRTTGRPVGVAADEPGLRAARCITTSDAILMIATETLRPTLRNGCEFLPNPNGLANALNAYSAESRGRSESAEYQARMRDYYGSSDAVLFRALAKSALTDETMASIREQLPYEKQIGPVLLLLRQAP